MSEFTASLGPVCVDPLSVAAATRARVVREALQALAMQTNHAKTMHGAAQLSMASDLDLDWLARAIK